MPKRKRAEPSGSTSPESKAEKSLHRRRNLCTQRLSAAQKPLISALRHAAGLERQKYSRRKKTAQSNKDSKATSRLDAEYAFLKGLQLETLAEQHLRKTIGKVKSLRESEVLPEHLKQVEKGEKDPALLNVQARLFKVDSVRKVVDEVIDDLKEIVSASAEVAKKNSAKQAKLEEDEVPEDDGEEDSEAFAAFDALIAAPSSADEDSEDSLSEGHRPPSVQEESESDGDSDDEDVHSAQGDEIPFHNFDDEDEEESDDALPSNSAEDWDDTSDSESDEASIPAPKAKRLAPEQPRAGESQFLPALSHMAYISGSESEASELDMEVAPRKNRRGQKARQKIWEQKYKDKAKHLQKQGRGEGWDPKRGAVDSNGRYGGHGGRGGPPRGRGPEKSGANEQPLGQKKAKRDDAGALHPSWQAAKAAKEKKVDIKPQGKKMVFD